MDKYKALSTYFGYKSFRQGQEEVIDNILDKKDVLAIMPTGAGKSVCFQVPALCMNGVTIIISPLISLMKDQVTALIENGINAAFINGSLTPKQMKITLSRMAEGKYKIVYVAPERLLTRDFLYAVDCLNISMIVVDEAHCVSQWGQDFRPAYLKIKEFIEHFETRPIVTAFTATATPKVSYDIEKLIGLLNPYKLKLSFDRPNLEFIVEHPFDKKTALKQHLDEFAGKSGIIYCSTRKNVDMLTELLSNQKYSVTKYHAGLSPQERKRNQELFINDEKLICVATNAFGMGIDKTNVSFVIHYNTPANIENYYQEAGRAGRDGMPATCILLYSSSDIETQLYFIDNPEENEELSEKEVKILQARRRNKLKEMEKYARAEKCLRSYILDYFSESSEDFCGNCSVCKSNERQYQDITVYSQMILSCLKRVKLPVEKQELINILKAVSSEFVEENHFENLSTYGLMKEVTDDNLNYYIDNLIAYKYIDENENLLTSSDRATTVLFENKKVYVQRRIKQSNTITNSTYNRELFIRLQSLRKEIAQEKHIPAFTIFTDRTLYDMSVTMPQTVADFLEIQGVTYKKFEKYGGEFLNTIKEYLE